jgi:hypothetical protein
MNKINNTSNDLLTRCKKLFDRVLIRYVKTFVIICDSLQDGKFVQSKLFEHYVHKLQALDFNHCCIDHISLLRLIVNKDKASSKEGIDYTIKRATDAHIRSIVETMLHSLNGMKLIDANNDRNRVFVLIQSTYIPKINRMRKHHIMNLAEDMLVIHKQR